MVNISNQRTNVAFEDALANPEVIDCPLNGQPYDVYQFNSAATERPLVVYLGLGTTALTGMGKAYLEGYVSAIDRPILTMRPHADIWAGLAERAVSDASVLDAIDVSDIDIVGASSGGMLASCLAVEVGKRARHLVTVSSVGTKTGYLEYIASLPNQFLDGFKEAMAIRQQRDPMPIFSPQSSNFFNVTRYGELMKTIRQTVNASLAETIVTLNDDTRWIDMIGTKDHMTDYKDHLALVRQRNQEVPRSSSVYLLAGESHMWATKRSMLQKMVKTAIE